MINAAAGYRGLLRTRYSFRSVGRKGRVVNDMAVIINNDICSVEDKVGVERTVAVVGENDYLDSKGASPLLSAPDDFHLPKG